MPYFFLEAGMGIANQLFISQQQGYKIKDKGVEIYKPTYGIGMELPIDNRRSFELGVAHYVTGAITEYRTTLKEYIQLKYIKVPINFRYNIKFGKAREGMFVTLGPYAAFMYKGWMTYNGMPYRVDKEPLDLFKKSDFGIGLGMGYQTPVGFYLRAYYSRGLKDLVKSTATGVNALSMYNVNAFAFTAGMSF